MQEVFYEETALIQNEKRAKIKYRIFKVLSIISYVLAALWAIIVYYGYSLENVNFLSVFIQIILPLAMFIVSGIMLGKYKNKMYVDYDYTFVTGSIRISKVINQIKRKGVIKFDTKDIIQLGKYGSESFEKIQASPGIKKLVLTSNVEAGEGKEFFYLLVNKDNEKKLLIFECTEKFMATVLKFSNKTILEKDYK